MRSKTDRPSTGRLLLKISKSVSNTEEILDFCKNGKMPTKVQTYLWRENFMCT